jgi:hypothetical protein
MQNKTSFHVNGFWFHCTEHGKCLKDQHGNYWIRKGNEVVSDCGSMTATIDQPKKTGWVSADDLFMMQRESDFHFHKQRQIHWRNY